MRTQTPPGSTKPRPAVREPRARDSLARSLRSPAFLSCAVLLAVSAVGLRPAMESLARSYSKEPIPLRRLLSDFDVAALHSFRVPDDPFRLEISPADVGTEHYLWLDLEENPKSDLVQALWLVVTYYSDPRDKVPHTPEVCYRQMGTTVENLATVPVEASGIGARSPVRASRMDLVQGDRRGVLVYVFCANGDYYYDREQVRWRIGTPGDRYVYFSKIEAIAWHVGDAAYAEEAVKKLLSEALTALAAEHFPTDADLRH